MGRAEYTNLHIPGAVYAHLDRDLSGPKTGTNGRHPLPDPHAFAHTLGRLGIESGVQVVAYDQDNGMYASRLWWLLRWLGHDAAAVLDGGFKKWTAEGRPTATASRRASDRDSPARRALEMAIDAQPSQRWSPADRSGSSTRARRNATAARSSRSTRRPATFPAPPIISIRRNLDDQGTFRTPEELREQLARRRSAPPPITHGAAIADRGWLTRLPPYA